MIGSILLSTYILSNLIILYEFAKDDMETSPEVRRFILIDFFTYLIIFLFGIIMLIGSLLYMYFLNKSNKF